MRAAVYVRISQDREGEALGVERQEQDARELAERRGWQVVAVYRDNDVSAYSRRPRPAYRSMLEAIERDELDAIVAYRSDRLYRRMTDLSELIELVERKRTSIATVASGEVDLTTADGRMIARIIGSVAEGESERSGERIRRQRMQQVSEGRRQGGGRRPFGWVDSSMSAHDDAEVVLVREAVRDVLAGQSLYAVTTRWNREGVTTPSGATWKPANLRRMLMGAHLAGVRVHARTGTRTQGAWEPIITEDEHALLCARLAAVNDAPPRVSRRTGLLSGIVACASCGTKLVHSAGRYYCDRGRAGGCGDVRVNDGRALERAVLDMSAERSASNTPRRRTRTTEATDALTEMRALDEREAMLTDMLANGDMDRAGFTRARQVILERRDVLEQVLRDAGEPTDDYAEQLNDAVSRWMAGDTMRSDDIAVLQPIIVRTLAERVYVQPRPRRTTFDPSQVTLTRDVS